MEVTVRELERWQPESYRMIDMRNAESLAYGTIPGAESRSAESLLEAPPENDAIRPKKPKKIDIPGKTHYPFGKGGAF